jgi:hypothetical protein
MEVCPNVYVHHPSFPLPFCAVFWCAFIITYYFKKKTNDMNNRVIFRLD